ncbi:MAG: GMC family oxidoreductase N-terminal domain-containing protein, partial [Pseudomonadota bacterium]
MSGVETDILIIGAGSAGCALADRLSRDSARRVTVIEAGPKDDHIFIRMPAAVAKAIGSPRFNWHFWTTPQAYLNNRRLTTPRGMTLGGSSSINALVYIRGNAWDFDNWADQGCPGWGYADVLPHFIAVEDNELGAGPYHGSGGPLHVSNPASGNAAYEAFINAGVELGYPRSEDLNGAEQTGFGPFQLNIKGGRRWSAADAFLKPAMARANLTVLPGARATGLIWDGIQAVGVRTQGAGDIRAAQVILAAGAIGTPHLLLLSGVGPADQLSAKGIPVVANRPGVGANLHDHLEVKVKHRMTEPLSLWRYAKSPNRYFAGLQYIVTGQGAGRQQGLEAGAFVTLDPSEPACDTQLHFINALAFDGATADDRGHGFAIDTTQTRPESRGRLTLASSDPAKAPLIDPNYLATDKDRRMMREGLKLLRDLCRQPSLANITGTELRPGADLTTDADLDAYVRATAESIYHPVGTARMGADDDAVVDPATMAVKGVDNLFVADASV